MSSPLKSPCGVYVNEPSGLAAKMPWAGSVTTWIVIRSCSPSLSLANTPELATLSTSPSSMENGSPAVAGGPLTTSVTVAVPDSALPSSSL